LTRGSTIVLTNGHGIEAEARITVARATGATYEVTRVETPRREPPIRLTVGLPILKGDRFEIAVQKLTEIGVAAIAPILTERSVISFDDARAWFRRADRYRRISREAAEQSERVTLPEICEPVCLATFLASHRTIALVERTGSTPILEVPCSGDVALAIGPEGGWSDRERTLIEQGATANASLGRLILRAETAAIVAAGILIQRAWATQTDEMDEGTEE
jgi:16S rRNA (uracil1498-N3)-methyltransferase